MTNHSNTQLVTDNTFSIIPHWVIFSGISSGSIHLYAVLTKYAENGTGDAFPSRSRLANDMEKTDRTIDSYIKELRSVGALKVTRRKRKGTEQNYTNLYTVITANPNSAEIPDLVEVEEGWRSEFRQVAKPVSQRTRPTELDPLLSTSDLRSDESVARARSASATTKDREYSPSNPGGLTHDQRWMLIKKLQITGRKLSEGHGFYDEPTMQAWDSFYSYLGEVAGETLWGDVLLDHINNGKWTVSAKVIDPYEAGVELNKMIHTAMKLAA